jgi:hypothetical protein
MGETMTTTNVEQEVRAAMQRWLEGTMAADAAVLDTLITPDFAYTHALSAQVEERESWLESFRTGGRIYAVYAISNERYRTYGNVVVLSATGHQEFVLRNEPMILDTEFMSVWVRGDDRAWRCSAWQATRIAAH